MPAARFTRRAALTAGTAWALTACSAQEAEKDDAAGGSPSASGPSASESGSVNPSSTPPAESAPSSSRSNIDHTSPDSLSVLVNKRHPLSPLDWAPSDLVDFGGVQLRAEVAQAAEQMFSAAAQQGLTLTMLSGFRSYDYQIQTYNNWVNTYGQEQADTASARPGYSEHQTGLAFDIGSAGGCNLQPCFAETPEAQWTAENCYKFGFVLRFPYWQHETTGYYFESWHFRYIGREQAQKYKDSEAENLESFWGFEAAADYQN